MIADLPLGHGHPCFVIAEIGAMYEDLEGMKELIRQARKAGADAVKLQTYRAETLALPGAEFEFEDGSRMSQLEFFKRYEISPDHHHTKKTSSSSPPPAIAMTSIC
jgi:sialic acid synthase SpsE